MSSEDESMVTGTVHSINVGKRGVEINITSDELRSAAPDDRPYFTCRIARSSANTSMMLEIAMTAMLNSLTVTLLGSGDDRDDTLEFDEIRVVGPQNYT